MRGLIRCIRLSVAALAITTLTLSAAPLSAADEDSVADQVRAAIRAGNRYISENLRDRDDDVSKHGSVQFWSSGGLMQMAAPDSPGTEYERFSLAAKHIEVIELPGGEAAVAMYYSEGSMQVKGNPPVGHYMTRVTEVYVKEDGKWVQRAGHWSAIASGAGTNQTSVE